MFALLDAERRRITEAMDDLAAARDALDRMVETAHQPTSPPRSIARPA